MYLLRAKTRYSIHSPFVFKLYSEVILSKKHYYPFDEIEGARKALLANENEITITDFGAGSQFGNGRKRKIKDIAQRAAKPEKFGKLFFRLVDHLQPKNIVELGTSLGMSTSYLAAANKNAVVETLEGCPETAKVARKVFDSLKLNNINITVGNFDETFQNVLSKTTSLDFVFIDGNHQYEPTVRYFKQCLPLVHEETLLIFDDIHWSDEMEKAWKEIQQHPEVTATVDLFFIGLVFFKKGREKEHFILQF
ncbi:MAG: class I SAM-dependent methyltransferase [Bacteroidetes bacterium]|nr:class I SAM-dependent methyltransferase [Bacteroidota bacterium]